MRHFLLPDPVTALALCMGVTAAQAGLIAAAGRTLAIVAGFFGAGRSAVTVAAITVATNQHSRAATGTQVASSRKVHWQSGPMG